eukprot:7210324-Pyramimonas_sp.AAC.1
MGDWKGNVAPILAGDSSIALRVVKKRGPGQMTHVESRFSAQVCREQKRVEFEKVHADDL